MNMKIKSLIRGPLTKSWMSSLSPDFPIAALVSTCNSPAITNTYRLALENSESQSASPRLNQRLPSLKTLPLIGALAIGLALSPTLSMADNGDRGRHKSQSSHDGGKSHSKGHTRSNKHSNKHHYKSHGKSHKGNRGHSSKHRYNKRHGHHNDHAYYRRDHHNHRYDNHRDRHHTTYIVNDHHYNDDFYGLDHLRFMIGLHTDNFDITFRD